MTFRRTLLLPLLAAATLGAGAAVAGTPPEPGVGVLVETTRGADPAVLRAAEAEVATLRARGADAELRVARSPSESLAAAATLVTRGAGRLIVRGVDERAVLDPLRAVHPRLRIERRGR